MVRLHVWKTPRGTWLAQCPALEIGGSGSTRDVAMRAIRKEVNRDAEMIFGTSIEVIEGPPPPMEDER